MNTRERGVVMRLCGDLSGPTPYDGQFLQEFDFEAYDGLGEVVMTPDVEKAKRFPTFMDALQFYRRVPKCKPIREDGQPNRPLTATNWEFRNAY